MQKVMTIHRFPKVLVIHLKRFYNSTMRREKLSTTLNIPERLDMREYAAGSSKCRFAIILFRPREQGPGRAVRALRHKPPLRQFVRRPLHRRSQEPRRRAVVQLQRLAVQQDQRRPRPQQRQRLRVVLHQAIMTLVTVLSAALPKTLI